MPRLIVAVFLILQPITLWASCEAADLIEALPADTRHKIEAAADETPYPQGLLWQAVKDTTTITLFGTYHFRHDRTEAHLEALKPVIEQADAVYLEVSSADQARLQKEISSDPSIMFITQGDALPDLLSEEEWKQLVKEMRLRGVPGFLAARFKPFWAAMMLGIGPCEARSNMMQELGIDASIGAYTDTLDNPSRSLEDYRTLLTLFDSFELQDQIDLIRLFFAWSGNADDLAYTLRQRYLAQDIALIWAFSRHISLETGGVGAAEDFELLEQQMLEHRNRGWVDVLLQENPGDTLFVAVGAAHLPGETGVLRLLEDHGFVISRLPFAG